MLSQVVEEDHQYCITAASSRCMRASTVQSRISAWPSCGPSLLSDLLRLAFTLYSHHTLLHWLQFMNDANSWITNWYLDLQLLKFKVIHRPVPQMTVAEVFARQRGDRCLVVICRLYTAPSLRQGVGVCGSGVCMCVCVGETVKQKALKNMARKKRIKALLSCPKPASHFLLSS